MQRRDADAPRVGAGVDTQQSRSAPAPSFSSFGPSRTSSKRSDLTPPSTNEERSSRPQPISPNAGSDSEVRRFLEYQVETAPFTFTCRSRAPRISRTSASARLLARPQYKRTKKGTRDLARESVAFPSRTLLRNRPSALRRRSHSRDTLCRRYTPELAFFFAASPSL